MQQIIKFSLLLYKFVISLGINDLYKILKIIDSKPIIVENKIDIVKP